MPAGPYRVNWFDEALHDAWQGQGYTQRLKITRLVHRQKTGHQDLVIFDTPAFGRVLALDGIVQTTERDEFAYHEMLAHVPILAHGGVRRVLIVGGGDGGTLREVLRHQNIEKAIQVEIDGRVVDLCREHMPGLSAGAYDDPRAELIIGDGREFVAGSDERFDVVIVDSTDPVGPGEPLFSAAFYADCKQRLASGGIVVTQSGVPFLQGVEAGETYHRLAAIFADAALYLTVVPSYIGGFMAFGWGTENTALRSQSVEMLGDRYDAAGLKARYYTPALHVQAFSLPPFIADLTV